MLSRTWGEFIEAGLLAQYRQSTGSMRDLWSFIERLRDELGVPCPIAHARPYVGTGRRLLMAAQEAAEADWSLVAVANRQLVLMPVSDARLSAGRVLRRRGGSLAASRRPEFAGHR